MKLYILIVGILSVALGCSSDDGTSNRSAALKKDAFATQEGASGVNNATGDGTQNQDPAGGDETISPPKQVSGAYMTATVLPEAGDTVIRVGIIGMLDDVRLSTEQEKYKSTWTLGFSESLPVIVKLAKSTDPDYDQILEFYGTPEQFKQYLAAIDVSLQFQENRDGAIVSSMVANSLDELLP